MRSEERGRKRALRIRRSGRKILEICARTGEDVQSEWSEKAVQSGESTTFLGRRIERTNSPFRLRIQNQSLSPTTKEQTDLSSKEGHKRNQSRSDPPTRLPTLGMKGGNRETDLLVHFKSSRLSEHDDLRWRKGVIRWELNTSMIDSFTIHPNE